MTAAYMSLTNAKDLSISDSLSRTFAEAIS